MGDKWGAAVAVTGVGVAAMRRGDIERATAHLREGLALYREAGDRWGVAQLLPYLGSIAAGQGNHPRALACFEEGLALARELGDRLGSYKSLYNLALVAQARGDCDRAARLYAEGLRLADELGDAANLAYCLEGLAGVAARGEPERAARLYGSAEALLDTVGGPRHPYVPDRSAHRGTVAALRARLGEEAYAAAWAAGRALPLERAVAYALAAEDAPPAAP